MDSVDDVQEIEDAEGDVTERRRLGDSRWWFGIAATIFFALWGWRELAMRAAHEHIASRDAEIETLSEEKQLLQQKNEKLNSAIATLAAPDTRIVSLSGQQAAPSASARVFVDPAKHRALAIFANLPANPSDKSYQLWIVRADQASPESACVFDVTNNGTATATAENLSDDANIKSMGVTLEPKGGSHQPTNTNFYLIAKP